MSGVLHISNSYNTLLKKVSTYTNVNETRAIDERVQETLITYCCFLAPYYIQKSWFSIIKLLKYAKMVEKVE